MNFSEKRNGGVKLDACRPHLVGLIVLVLFGINEPNWTNPVLADLHSD